jgi:hypothetical protein
MRTASVRRNPENRKPARVLNRGLDYVQAIEVKYFGPGNTRGARMVAITQAGRKSVPYDHSLNPFDNAAVAAEVFARHLDWHGEMVGGGLHSGHYAFVFLPK